MSQKWRTYYVEFYWSWYNLGKIFSNTIHRSSLKWTNFYRKDILRHWKSFSFGLLLLERRLKSFCLSYKLLTFWICGKNIFAHSFKDTSIYIFVYKYIKHMIIIYNNRTLLTYVDDLPQGQIYMNISIYHLGCILLFELLVKVQFDFFDWLLNSK